MLKNKESILTYGKILHRITLGIGALSILVPILFWNKIPEKIPMHFGANGEVDHIGEKSGLILLFFVILLLMGVMSIAIYFVKTNAMSQYAKIEEQTSLTTIYPMLVIMNLFMMCGFSYMIFCTATGRNLGILFLPIFLVSTFAPMAYYLGKSKKVMKTYHEEMKDFQYMEQEEDGEVFPAHVDWWLGILLGGALVSTLWFFVSELVQEGNINWLKLGVLFLVGGLVCPLFFIKYILFSKHILVWMPIYGKVRIPYEGIVAMKETHNPISSAAPSLDRIQIDYVVQGRHDMILISPSRKKKFIEKVEAKRQRE